MKSVTVERMLLAGVLVVTSAGWLGRVTAQATQTPADVLPALLVEVRGLRAAMEQMASAGPRVQLFASRLQLQEARINTMSRRLQEVRHSLASGQQALAATQAQQQQSETALGELRARGTAESQAEAKHLELMLEELKRNTIATRTMVDRLTAEETQLTGDIATEQGRWSEINARLDELERLLSRR